MLTYDRLETIRRVLSGGIVCDIPDEVRVPLIGTSIEAIEFVPELCDGLRLVVGTPKDPSNVIPDIVVFTLLGKRLSL
jgi:hypothetical protein